MTYIDSLDYIRCGVCIRLLDIISFILVFDVLDCNKSNIGGVWLKVHGKLHIIAQLFVFFFKLNFWSKYTIQL